MAVTLAALILVGCATRTNWQEREGVYTYNQAVVDYGQPLSETKLNDGSTVAVWMTNRGQTTVSGGPYNGPYYGGSPYRGGYYNGGAGPGYATTYSPARFLRLEFGPDNKLKAWKEFTK